MTDEPNSTGKTVTHFGIAIGIWIAAIALVGDAVVAFINGANDQILESKKAEASRILESLKTGNPDASATNLKFLLDAGLITDRATAQGLIEYLDNRKTGEGAFLPKSGTTDLLQNESETAPNDLMSDKAKGDLLRKYGIKPGEDLRPLTPRWVTRDTGNAR